MAEKKEKPDPRSQALIKAYLFNRRGLSKLLHSYETEVKGLGMLHKAR